MITDSKKQKIAEKLQLYCDRFGSQNKAANSLRNVSGATISQMLNHNWELITDDMWRNVAAQIGYTEEQWVIVETRDSKLLTTVLNDAKENSLVFGIVGDSGYGKTQTLKHYKESNKNAYVLHCAEYWNRKTFLQELLTDMGRDYSGYTVAEMMQEVVRLLKMIESPIVILDEADKLSDQVLYFFITMYNQLEDHCALIIIATDHLSKRIKRGLKLNKKGYKEIYSRIGRKFIELKGPSTSDIKAICMANGITANEQIKDIIEDCENDLRRVKRKIHAFKKAA